MYLLYMHESAIVGFCVVPPRIPIMQLTMVLYEINAFLHFLSLCVCGGWRGGQILVS